MAELAALRGAAEAEQQERTQEDNEVGGGD
jgi:hypothetical protein